MMTHDAVYMAKALALAKKGRYTTDPNPRVGCVLVKANKIIAEGWHQWAGQGHAEIEALKKATDVVGATAYVTLEPCSHYGKTPPCCEALIQAKVARVVVAMQDPNPLVAGKGLVKLQQAGIEVLSGVLEADARLLNQGFIKRMTEGLPFIRSKLAMSLDGRTAMASGESKWITGDKAREDVQRLRAKSSAILTGINTVLADNPRLNVRLETEVLQPIRVVLDSQLQMPLNARMLELEGRSLILTCSENAIKKRALEAVGFEVFVLPSKQGRLDLKAVFLLLASEQVNEVLVEAGAVLNGALLESGLVDQWIIYMAPVILGDEGRGLFTVPSLRTMADKKRLTLQQTRQVGEDLRCVLV
ncbi:MAG: bifunctional diaminohydroxyphosphoribosylaminopyrimidine deaminase/5-amino-6-(5-phosphoribosylamino)uracil reductase RibD [Methylococcales bacterium]|nr:bifunctional diaminohydroxyphosphoribosylaminopyrimidine deaminase/5-amino-6-(5-phosphoribosylamino)uracil reductase RibD [Methylococcales bacterium]